MSRHERRAHQAEARNTRPLMSRRERRYSNRLTIVFGAGVVLLGAAYLWHIGDEAITNLIVYVPTDQHTAAMKGWLNRLRRSGLHVHLVGEGDPAKCRSRLHIPDQFAAPVYAMTTNPSRYVLAGYVPPSAIARMLHEQPQFQGLIVLDEAGATSDPSALAAHGMQIWGFWNDGHKELYMLSSSAPAPRKPPQATPTMHAAGTIHTTYPREATKSAFGNGPITVLNRTSRDNPRAVPLTVGPIRIRHQGREFG